MLIRHDPDIGHRFVPNQRARLMNDDGGYFVVTNSVGFRSDFEFLKPLPKWPRILMFGDSYTAGDNCSNGDRYSDQLGSILGAEVQNYGVSGTGTDQHLLTFRKFARDVEADLVMICVQIDSFRRIQMTHRPVVDRLTGQLVMVPKPYFELVDGQLTLKHVPVPVERPVMDRGEIETAGTYDHWYDRALKLYRRVPALKDVRNANLLRDPISRAVDFYRWRGPQPYDDVVSPDTPGWLLMRALLEQFIDEVRPRPCVIVPIPSSEFYLIGSKPIYQELFESLDDPKNGVHVADVSTVLIKKPRQTRQQYTFEHGGHFSPFAHRIVAETMATFIESRGLLPRQVPNTVKPLLPASERIIGPRQKSSTYILGISCFYHNSAASLIRDGKIVAAAEEERFTRVKNDRGFPYQAINYCLEEAGIHQNDLAAIVYYDNSALTLERILASLVAVDSEAAKEMWQLALPPWLRLKLHLSKLIRETLHYDGLILQGLHHRSHAASCFYPSPFERAAILTVDGVGEWATGSIGVGRASSIELLREMHFPNSLGLLYSAFTQFTGFKVNSGEYKMMGLAPYGEPKYVRQILDNLVDLKDDGSVELNMKYFGFLQGMQMTNNDFAELFDGPPRKPDSRITRRETDLARSIQEVTEEALLRMARTAHQLTGEDRLCLAGGVALNCVANGRILREGPFRDIWIQPAAGDAGASLGAALDVHHAYFGNERVMQPDGRPMQSGSLLGPQFNDDEVRAYLETFGFPYTHIQGMERADYLAQQLMDGRVVGHFAGKLEFGPRALGARSILGDARDSDMQAKLNLRIKFRESFRPFAPAVLAEHVSEYFELDRESPYMLIVAPVCEDRRLPLDVALPEDDDLLPVVRRLRSDIPAVTHVDYSARIQTVKRQDNPPFYDLIDAFREKTGYAVIVNTSFNVRGEPITCTPADAYRCFMRTDMDVLALGDFILHKEGQPVWNEGSGRHEALESEDNNSGTAVPNPEPLMRKMERVFLRDFWPIAQELRQRGDVRISLEPTLARSMWVPHEPPGSGRSLFEIDPALLDVVPDASLIAEALTRPWREGAAKTRLRPILGSLIALGLEYPQAVDVAEPVSDSMYMMF
jgi:carbamoyltransferase